MIDALKLCSLALNHNAPSPFASMVKVDGGMMVAYGGGFCIRVPVDQDIGAAFSPKALATFFRIPRDKVAYTIKFPKLTVSHKKERLTINCLSPDELVTIDNIETPTACTINKTNLKRAADLIETTNTNPFALNVVFRDGAVISTNNKVFFMGESGYSGPEFNISKEAALALARFKSPVIAISRNAHTVKFIHEDGSSLCAHISVAEFPAIDFLFEGDWQPFKITDDILAVDCDYVVIRQNSVFYHTEGEKNTGTIGEIENAVQGKVELCCKKQYFNELLKVSNELEFISEQRIKAVGDDCAIISSMYRPKP